MNIRKIPILKIIFSIIIFYAGCHLLYLRTSTYAIMSISYSDEVSIKNYYKDICSTIKIPENAVLISEGLVRRNYSYGYRYKYKDNGDFKNTIAFFDEQLNTKGYDVKLYGDNKIRAIKKEYIIDIYKDNSYLLNYDKQTSWYMYIKPNDIFEWGYLDFGAFTIGNFWF